MMNLLKKTYLVALGVMTLGFTSCTNEYEYDAPSATEHGGNAFISSTGSTTLYFGDKEEKTFYITVARVDTTAAETIHIISNDADVAPQSEVVFAAGELSKKVAVKVSCPANTQKKATIAIADDDAFIYATNKMNFSINVGKQFTASLVSDLNESTSEVNIFRFETQNSKSETEYDYIVDQPYDKGYYISFSIDFANNTAVLNKQYAGLYNDNYGRIQMAQTVGTYDSSTKTVSFKNVKFSLPDSGYSMGTGNEIFTFTVSPDVE